MRIIAKRTLKKYWEEHRDCEQQLLSWYKIVKKRKYQSFDDLRRDFGQFKVVGSDRVIFKIKGNHYRLVVKMTFTNQIVYIRFIGTHDEYDRIDVKTI